MHIFSSDKNDLNVHFASYLKKIVKRSRGENMVNKEKYGTQW